MRVPPSGAAGDSEPAPAVRHEPVLAAEVPLLLAPRPGDVVVDATLGLGGHALLLLEQVGPHGLLVGLDRDAAALALARERLQARCAERGWLPPPVRLFHADFRRLGSVLVSAGLERPRAVLFDLGVSSMQLDLPARGFSFRGEGPLDMRMDPESGEPASSLLARLGERELAELLWQYGEERYARRIARAVVEARKRGAPPATTAELERLVWAAYPAGERHGRLHPATRTFQALRIAVNDELGALEPALTTAAERLAPGGRLAVLSYHSLEDRIVKRTLARLAGQCTCPPEAPGCTCGARPLLRLLTRRPITPSAAETAHNPRARSARLRAAERNSAAEAA
jgi:16S rRNA (cytosine1402-N4)-methyltransferase